MHDAIRFLLPLLYFMAPAYFANMAPPFTRFWHGWNRPISRRWLGDHKTVLGFAAGVGAGILTGLIQRLIDIPSAFVDSSRAVLLGALFGFGAMTGDAVKSLVKRRLGIAPGARWIPFDQLDFVVGALLFVGPLTHLRVADVLAILAMSFMGDLCVNQLAFRCGIKASPW